MKLGVKIFFVYICICFSILVQSCREPVPPPPLSDPCDILAERTQQLKASVYLDASGSMQGFVNLGNLTIYAQVIQTLNDVFLRGWSKPNIIFYKFSDTVTVLPNRTFLQALNSNFYSGKETNIQEAFVSANPDDLTVFVTDLCQADNDVTLLVEKLRDKLFTLKSQCKKDKHPEKSLNLSIGVLGIKSQFNGVVANGHAFDYETNENSESYRPFYILMLGKHADVVNYFEQIMSCNPKTTSEKSFTILSGYLTDLFSAKNIRLISRENLQTLRIVKPMSQNESQKKLSDERFIQIRIKNIRKEVRFKVEFCCQLLPYVVSVDPRNIDVEVIAEKLQSEGLENKPEAKQNPLFATKGKKTYWFEDDSYAKRNIIIEEKTLSVPDGKLNLKIKIIPTNILKKGVYRYKFTLLPARYESSYMKPDWWAKWDMGFTEDGSKTLNLNRFLIALWQATIHIYQPKIAEFYCYVKIN